MKLIKLTQGKFAQVDDADEWLNVWKWHAVKIGHTYYAQRKGSRKEIKRITYFMHRVILNTPKGVLTDHQDHNGLNNQRFNIRNANRSQNMMNNTSHKDSSSKYLGVSIIGKGPQKGQIRVRIRVKGKNLSVGYFKTEEEAAHAYDEAAKKYYGEFANLNFK